MVGMAWHRQPRTMRRVRLSKRRCLWTTYDLGNFSLLAALILILIGIEQVQPHHRYINAADPTINYPLMAQEVPMWLLVVLVGVVPVCIIIGIFVLQRRSDHAKRELYYVLFGWAYSMVLTVIMTDFMKRVSGRPRPNFVQLAGYQPDGAFTASTTHVSDAFQSFPSGHTSSAFSGYLSLYLFRLCFTSNFQTRELAQTYHVNQGWKTVLCLLPIGLAIWIGLTRIVDYWHNFDDVSIGACIGLTVCVLTFHLHVNWWWRTLHGPSDHATLTHVMNGNGMGCDDGPSSVPHYTALASPDGTSNHATPTPNSEAPLIDDAV
jgi:diacylglycerol diphosphate phosphatase/phosphatidate phosphatase